jgi:hypothetical protein
MKQCGCGNEIPQERYDLGYKVCVVCGEKFAQKKKPYGYLNFGHKTAGSIVITNKTMFEQYKAVSYRHCKGSNMASASKQSTCVVNFS